MVKGSCMSKRASKGLSVTFSNERPTYHLIESYKNKSKHFIRSRSQRVRQVRGRSRSKKDKIKVIHNGAADDLFLYKEIPAFSERTIYIGKIEIIYQR